MLLVYPSSPFDRRQPDETFEDEYRVAAAAGITVSLCAESDASVTGFRLLNKDLEGASVLYRGWMMTPERYAAFETTVRGAGGVCVTSSGQYKAAHWLPEWVSLIPDLTAKTVVLSEDADFEAELAPLAWGGYFVKDYVKSVSTGQGSLVDEPGKVAKTVATLKHYRGSIEGGICVREGESYVQGTERRYFVARNTAYGADGMVPPIVQACSDKVNSPFFSVDVAMRGDGILRVVELGDGQVSDVKDWSLDAFISMLVKEFT